jgi:hypothetical protein
MSKLGVLVLCFSYFTINSHLPLQFLKTFWIQRNSHFSFEKKKIQNQRNLQFQFFSKTSNASSFIEGFIDWFCLPSMCFKCCSKLVLSTEVAMPRKSNYGPCYPKPQKPNTKTLDEICLLRLTLLHGFDTIE